ncbi:MAG: tetratricopeptide repeat protein [Bryobacteraceae bacterium]|nr:tetratricopeptide repeat protein [Bryobacteraceae bacterium]
MYLAFLALSLGQIIAVVALFVLGFLIATRRKQLSLIGRQTCEDAHQLGLAAMERNDLAAAEKHLYEAYDKASSLRENREAPLSLSVLYLAKCHYKAKRYDDAERFAGEASVLLEDHANPHTQRLPEALEILSEICLQRGDVEMAEQHLHKAAEFTRQRFGAKSPEMARRLTDIADFLGRTDRDADAITYYQQAIEIHDKSADRNQQITLAPLLLRLGVGLTRAGRHRDASPALRRGLTWVERFHGPDSAESAPFLDALAVSESFAGNYHAVADLLHRAVQLRQQKFGPEHPEVAASLAQWADSLRKLRRYDEALEAAGRALHIQERVEDPERYGTLEILAHIKYECGEHVHADEYFRNALVTLRQAVGEQSLEVAEYLEKHAMIKKRLGETDAAQAMNDRAEEIRRNWAEIHA